MKFVLFYLFCFLSACAPEAGANSNPIANKPDNLPTVMNAPAMDLAPEALPIREVHITQYEDRLPTDPGSHLPPLVTLVEFQTDVCETGLINGDFSLTVARHSKGVAVTVRTRRQLKSCSNPQSQTFTASSGVIAAGQQISVLNPLTIVMMAPAE
jgi:hypothetical protein